MTRLAGRDLLAPAAAHLAAAALGDLGEAVEPLQLVEIRIPEPFVEAGRIACEVLDLNHFGNVQLNVRPSHLAAASLDQADRILVEAESGGGLATQVSTSADLTGDQRGLMVDPRGWLSVTRGNTANAAEALGVGSVDLVWLSRESDSAITRPWDKGVDSFHWPCGQNPGRKPEGSRRAFCARGEEPRRTEFDLQGQYLSRQRRRPG